MTLELILLLLAILVLGIKIGIWLAELSLKNRGFITEAGIKFLKEHPNK